jgi:hypothetical protein
LQRLNKREEQQQSKQQFNKKEEEEEQQQQQQVHLGHKLIKNQPWRGFVPM